MQKVIAVLLIVLVVISGGTLAVLMTMMNQVNRMASDISTVKDTLGKPAVTPAKTVKVGMIGILSVPFWDILHLGATKAATEGGFQLIYYTPPSYDVGLQLSQADIYAALGVDSYVIAPDEAASFVPFINHIVADEKIPVITLNFDSPTSKRLAFVGYDSAYLGTISAQYLVWELKQQGITSGGLLFVGHTLTESPVPDIYPAWQKVITAQGFSEIGPPLIDGGDPSKTRSLGEEAIAKYGDNLKGLWTIDDYEGPVWGQLIQEKGLQNKIVLHCNSLIGAMIPYMKSGAIKGTTDFSQYQWGYISTKLAYQLAIAGPDHWADVLRTYIPDYPSETMIHLQMGLITSQNLTAYAQQNPDIWAYITGGATTTADVVSGNGSVLMLCPAQGMFLNLREERWANPPT
jgi:ABC-type sugar transport system substrate-binding protein